MSCGKWRRGQLLCRLLRSSCGRGGACSTFLLGDSVYDILEGVQLVEEVLHVQLFQGVGGADLGILGPLVQKAVEGVLLIAFLQSVVVDFLQIGLRAHNDVVAVGALHHLRRDLSHLQSGHRVLKFGHHVAGQVGIAVGSGSNLDLARIQTCPGYYPKRLD